MSIVALFNHLLNDLYNTGNPVALKAYYRLDKLLPHADLDGVHWVMEDLLDDLRAHGVATNDTYLVYLAGQLAGYLGGI